MGDAVESQVGGVLRGRAEASAGWRAVWDDNNQGALLLRSGDVADARLRLERAVAATEHPLTAASAPAPAPAPTPAPATADAERLDLRARALINLAALREQEGRFADALRASEAGVEAAEQAIALVGDERGTVSVAITGLISRAQTLGHAGRSDEAFAHLDRAAHLLADDRLLVHETREQVALLEFSMHNSRTSLLITLGRLREAGAAAQAALVAANASGDPSLAAHVYANLGAIAQRSGDRETTRLYMQLAHRANEQQGDAAARQLSLENLARVAFDEGNLGEAAKHFDEAAKLARDAGLVTRFASCRMGAATVAVRLGQPGAAAKTLRRLISELERVDNLTERAEAYGFLGDAEAARGKFAAAETALLQARELARSVHDRCRIDLRRAVLAVQHGNETILPAKRRELVERAVALVVPVALATEALRDDFPPGATRERWNREIAAPARTFAFQLAASLGDAALVVDLIENAAASATFQLDAAETEPTGHTHGVALDRWRAFDDEHVGRTHAHPEPKTEPEPEPETEPAQAPQPAAVAGIAATLGGTAASDGMHGSGVRFAAPPRVVAMPGREPSLERWIAIAEAEYGVRVRSTEVVASW